MPGDKCITCLGGRCHLRSATSFHSVVLAVLFCPIFLVMPGCKAGPPTNLVIQNDHHGLAEWYEEEAVRLRSRADEMRRMLQQYDNPSYPLSPKETKHELIAHCETYIKYYTQAAGEADALAKIHRQTD